MLTSTRLVDRAWVAQETFSVQVERPEGFTFQAGQYADLTVLNPPDRDALGPIRSLSIASAPDAPHLEFVMRLRDTAFKRTLAAMPAGTELLIEGPFDDLRLECGAARPLVFLAGGVGIAPFMSALRGAASGGGALQATLFYANRRPEDAAYLEELLSLERKLRGFRMVPTMTRISESRGSWRGETARLGVDLLARNLPALVGPSYYVVGSPRLISQMRVALRGAGVDDADIGLEMYAGY